MFTMLTLAVFVVFMMGCLHTPPIDPNVLITGTSTISKNQTIAENYVKRLKKEYNADSETYKEGNHLYLVAQAGFNGWIDALKAAIVLPLSKENKSTLKAALDNAEASSDKFVKYVRTGTRSPLVVAEAIKGFGEVGIDIWKAIQKVKAEERAAQIESIKGSLEAAKWKSFDAIE